MTSLTDLVLDAAAQPVTLMVARATLVIAVGTVVALACHWRSAATRHLVWALTLAAAFVVSVASLAGPSFDVTMREVRMPAPIATTLEPGGALVSDAQMATPEPSADVTPSQAPSPWTRTQLLAVIWAAGALAVAARHLLGHAGLAVLGRRAHDVRDPEWLASFEAARSASQTTKCVRLIQSSAVGAPVTWGYRRPVIVIPADAHDWTADRRRVVLLHEFAHIARNDYLVQVGASVVAALYWFHPLAWFAARSLRREAEHACDDQVLTAGTSGTDYAAHLLSVARGARALRLTGAVAIGMARRSTLEGRMLAIIDSSRSRATPSRGARAASTFTGIAVALVVAGVHPVEVAAAEPLSAPAVIVSAVAPVAAPVKTTAQQQRARVTPPVQQAADSIINQSVRATPGGTLHIDLVPGGTVFVRGWDEPRVELRAQLGGADWRNVKVTLAEDSRDVLLRSDFDTNRGEWRVNSVFELRVPRKFNVQLRSGGGTVEIENMDGSFNGRTGGGTITLRGLKGDAQLSTGGGQILVSDSQLDGTVSTGGGNIEMERVTGTLQGSTGGGEIRHANGQRTVIGGQHTSTHTYQRENTTSVRNHDTDLHIGSRTDGMMHVNKSSGHVTIDHAPLGANVTTGSGDIDVRGGNGMVHATTGSGMIHIGPIAGSIEATTGSGNVEVSIIDAKGEPQHVNIVTGAGKVIVEVPAGFDGRIDLESGFTERSAQIPTISVPWRVTTETTQRWETQYGTPRRFVRANAQIGNGPGLIKVRTMNGDIEVRTRR